MESGARSRAASPADRGRTAPRHRGRDSSGPHAAIRETGTEPKSKRDAARSAPAIRTSPPDRFGAALAAAGTVVSAVDAVARRPRPACVLRGAPAGPSRVAGPGHGVLRLQQHRDRRAPRRPRVRRRADPDRRLGRAPWQRHAGGVLERRLGAVLRYAPASVVSRHGQPGRNRRRQRARPHRQPAVPGRRGPRRDSRRISDGARARGGALQAAARDDFGRLRFARRRSARQVHARPTPISPSSRRSSSRSRGSMRADASCRCSKEATRATASRAPSPRISIA